MIYFIFFISVFILSFLLNFFLVKLKEKSTYLPEYFLKRFGGLAVAFCSLLGISVIYFLFDKKFPILFKDYGSIVVASLVIIIGGLVDDKKKTSAFFQFFYQFIAIIIFLGVKDTINHVNLPIWGMVHFGPVLNYLLSFFWFLIILNSFNWFDGVDGLAGGLGFIAMIFLFFLSLTPIVNQPQTAMIALIIAGAILGFWFLNFFGAKIYLGSVGSYFIAMMLALISVYSGGKVATAALILGIPILDFVFVSVERMFKGRLPWQGKDRRHLHYRLLDQGMSQKKLNYLFYFLSLSFGLAALTLQTDLKIIAFLILMVIFLLIAFKARVLKKTVYSK
ncbi:MAG: hypothetical protein GF335_04655 [Candidatus Moranbacteria bacterium]|nr:hypothetical protein [Candidatus Moranbacteria bacterium]